MSGPNECTHYGNIFLGFTFVTECLSLLLTMDFSPHFIVETVIVLKGLKSEQTSSIKR